MNSNSSRRLKSLGAEIKDIDADIKALQKSQTRKLAIKKQKIAEYEDIENRNIAIKVSESVIAKIDREPAKK